MATGTITTWIGAMAGGSERPLSSPWTMMTPPIMRVETPQLVWNGVCSWLFLSANVMPKLFAKPSPK